MRNVCRLLSVILLLACAASASAAGDARKDRCIVNRPYPGAFPLNTFVFRQVEALNPGGAITVRGIYFTGSSRPAPFHGSAIMGADGKVRLGIFVHASAERTNDFSLSGVTDAEFAGIVNFDSDGDFVSNGTLALELVNCDTITIP
jgi:hypothetical protein